MSDENAIGGAQRTNANVRSVGAVRAVVPRWHRHLTVVKRPVRLMRTFVLRDYPPIDADQSADTLPGD